MTRIISLFLLFILSASCLRAQTGTTVYSFLKLPVSPISSSLGGSQVGSAQKDISLVADNPSIADSSMDQNLNLGYFNYVTNINQASIAYGRELKNIGFASAYLRYLDYGSFDETDPFGNKIGEFKVSDYELGLSFSSQLGGFERLRYGVTFKQVYSAYYEQNSYGLGLDFGAHYTSADGLFTAGMVIDNVGGSLVDYSRDGSKAMPLNAKIGVAKKLKKAPLRFGIQYENIERWDLAAADADAQEITSTDEITGETTRRVLTLDNFARHLRATVEVLPSENFNILVGYNFRRRLELALNERAGLVGFSFGTYIKIKRIQLQYGLMSYSLGGTAHMLSISTNLREWYRKA